MPRGEGDESTRPTRARPVPVDARKCLALLSGAAVLIVLMGVIGQLMVRGAEEGLRQTLGRPFILDSEISVPTWFSGIVLVAVAGAAWWISTLPEHQEHRRRWQVLAVMFAYMSLDESIIIHEMADGLLAPLFGLSGDVPDFPLWILPAGIVVVIAGVYLLPLFRELGRGQQRLWVAALLLYTGGALGVEVVSRPLYALPSEGSLAWLALNVLEEGMEMAGAIVFLYSLLREVEAPAR